MLNGTIRGVIWTVGAFTLGLMLFGCAPASVQTPQEQVRSAQPGPYSRPKVRLYAFEWHQRYRKPRIPTTPPSPDLPVLVKPGTVIGTVQTKPERLSERHHDTLMRAERLYSSRRYEEAVNVLAPAYRDEPDNPFVLESYARALFRAERRPEAFPVYKRLIAILDEHGKPKGDSDIPTIVIDAWFYDAYWKKGLIHLDRGEWEEAAFDITRAYAGMTEPAIVDQALQYLTEAFFNLGAREIARYYADETLRHNPGNTYVLPYLEKLRR